MRYLIQKAKVFLGTLTSKSSAQKSLHNSSLTYNELANRISSFMGADFSLKIDLDCKTERFGSDYGGWNIVLDNINKGTIVYSFGVGEDATFDLGLINRFQLVVHAFDPTPKSINWVLNQGFPDNFVLHQYGLADFDGEITFFPPENPDYVSHTILDRPETRDNAINVPVRRLQTIMKKLGHDYIDILKMDIEGAEYQVIEDMARSDIKPGQVLVEFHHRFPNVGADKTIAAIRKLEQMGYSLFYVSESGEELCFKYK